MLTKVNRTANGEWIDNITMIFMIAIVIILSSNLFILDLSLPQSPFIWPILIVAGFALIIMIHKSIQLYLKRKLIFDKLKNELTYLLLAMGVGLLISIFGYFQEAYFAANERMYSGIFGILTTIVNHENQLVQANFERIMKFQALQTISIYLTIIIALFGYFLHIKLKRLES